MNNPKIFDHLWNHFSFIGNQGHRINVLPPKGSYGASICRHPQLRTVCTAFPKPDKSCRMATAQWGNVGKIATKGFKMGESRTNIVDGGLQSGTKWDKVGQSGKKRDKVGQNWTNIVDGGLQSGTMGQSGAKWDKAGQTGTKRGKARQSGVKWDKVEPRIRSDKYC